MLHRFQPGSVGFTNAFVAFNVSFDVHVKGTKTADNRLFQQIVLSRVTQVQTILEEMEQNFTTMNDKIMAQIALMDTRLKSFWQIALMTTTFDILPRNEHRNVYLLQAGQHGANGFRISSQIGHRSYDIMRRGKREKKYVHRPLICFFFNMKMT